MSAEGDGEASVAELQEMVESLSVDKEQLALEKELAEEKVRELEAAAVTHQATVEGLNVQNQRLLQALAALRERHIAADSVAKQAAPLMTEVAELRDRVKAAESAKEAMTEAVDAASGFEEMVEKLTAQNLELGRQVQDLTGKLRAAESDLDSKEAERNSRAAGESELRKQLETSNDKVTELTRQLAQVQSIADERTKLLGRYREAVERLKNDTAAKDHSLARYRTALTKLRDDNATLVKQLTDTASASAGGDAGPGKSTGAAAAAALIASMTAPASPSVATPSRPATARRSDISDEGVDLDGEDADKHDVDPQATAAQQEEIDRLNQELESCKHEIEAAKEALCTAEEQARTAKAKAEAAKAAAVQSAQKVLSLEKQVSDGDIRRQVLDRRLRDAVAKTSTLEDTIRSLEEKEASITAQYEEAMDVLRKESEKQRREVVKLKELLETPPEEDVKPVPHKTAAPSSSQPGGTNGPFGAESSFGSLDAIRTALRQSTKVAAHWRNRALSNRIAVLGRLPTIVPSMAPPLQRQAEALHSEARQLAGRVWGSQAASTVVRVGEGSDNPALSPLQQLMASHRAQKQLASELDKLAVRAHPVTAALSRQSFHPGRLRRDTVSSVSGGILAS